MTNSKVVRNVQEALQVHFPLHDTIPEYIATAIAKAALETFESKAGEVHSVHREIYERGDGYLDHLKERMTVDIIVSALKMGYLPATLPKLEERRTSYRNIGLPPQEVWPEDGSEWPEDSDWDTMVFKMTLPLRRADLDSQYTLQPKPKG